MHRFPKEMDVEETDRPLKIAVVYSRIPVPMRRADQMTVAHLLSFLRARGHSVDLYCFSAGGAAEPEDLEWLRATCQNVFLYNHGVLNIAGAFVRTALSGVPVQVGLFSSTRQRHDLEQRLTARAYDVIYTYYFRSAEITRGLGREALQETLQDKPVSFLALQLSQTLNTRRIAKNAPDLFSKAFYEVESRLVARYETRIWQEFSHTVLIGPRDVEEIQAACKELGRPPIDNYVFGAHGTDVSRFCPRPDVAQRPNHLVFAGVMRTPTNIQAAQWFARRVWPIIRAAKPAATWSIVGREPSSEVLKLGKLEGVEVTGTVSDPAVRIAEAAICINPMQAGGGMQNKLIEYLASGKPIVATSVANEGIGAIAGEHLLIADKPEEFAQAVLHLLNDPVNCEALGARARDYVLRNWTWEAHFLKLEENFFSALDRKMADKQSDFGAGALVDNVPAW
jgi:glycosyltransferase involved in cell wall biosynthesis